MITNKTVKTIGAMALTVGLTTVAQAQTDIYITGSTAFRAQVFAGLADLGLGNAQGSANNANQFTFSGTISNPHSISNLPSGLVGQSVVVFCSWSGSAEGVQQLISPGPAIYDSNAVSGTFNHNGADLAFSDVAQYSTPEAGSSDQLTEIQTAADSQLPEGTGIAVQAFAFVGNSNAFTTLGIKNITQDNFLDVFESGKFAASYLNGVTADTNVDIYPVGRYNLSGTRITSVEDDNGDLDDTATPLKQYALSTDGVTTPGLNSTDTSPVPSGSSANQWVAVGDSGYFSGGNVGAAIHNGSLAGAPAAIAYIGWADAQSKLTDTTHEGPITWQGQTPGKQGAWNLAGVEVGAYNFWSYERLYHADAATSFIVNTFGPGLIEAIQYEIVNTSPRTAILESEMHVVRANDGADPL